MARKKTPHDVGFSYGLLHGLLKSTDPEKLWKFILEHKPDSKARLDGTRILTRCIQPDHDDSTPSCFINTGEDSGYVKCYGCGYYSTNLVEVVKAIAGVDDVAALQIVKKEFGAHVITPKVREQYEKWYANQEAKRVISLVAHEYLVTGVGEGSSDTALNAAIDYLVTDRKLNKDVLHELPIGVVPPVELLISAAAEMDKQRGLTTDVGIAQHVADYITGKLTIDRVGALLFTNYLTPSVIGRFRTRLPGTKDITVLEDAFETDTGFFGLGWDFYQSLFKEKKPFNTYIVEGEFDALSVMSEMVIAGPTGLFIAGGGSSGGSNIDYLTQTGIKTAVLVSDSPDYNGDKIIEQWLPEANKVACKVFIGWDQFPGVKDPDDIIQGHGLKKLMLELEAPANVISAHQWALEQAAPLLESCQEDDIRERVEIATKYGKMLSNTVERQSYVSKVAETYNISPSLISRGITADGEDEQAFILRLADALKEHFHIIGHQQRDRGTRALVLWDPEKKLRLSVALATATSIEEKLSLSLGPLPMWIRDKVGEPIFLQQPTKDTIVYLHVKRAYLQYVQEALNILAESVPDIDNAQIKDQGLHKVENDYYLINGQDVYHASAEESDELVWETLKGPSHNGILFNVSSSQERWLPQVLTHKDIDPMSKKDLLSAYDEINEMFYNAWKFKHHALESEYLTALVLACQVMGIMPRQTTHMFTADTNAGKSNCLSVFGGRAYPEICLVQNSIGNDSYSAASVRSQLNNKTHVLCLDEFENDGSNSKKSKIAAEILENMRSATGNHGVVTIGTRNGGHIKFIIKTSPFYAAIHKPREAADINRVNLIEMERQPGRGSPVETIKLNVGLERILSLRRGLSTGLFKYVPQILESYATLSARYGTGENLPYAADNRFLTVLFPALSIMDFLGKDVHEFLTQYLLAKQDRLVQVAKATESDTIFSLLLYAATLRYEDAEGNYKEGSASQLLASPSTREEINLSGSGLFYDKDSELLIVLWPQAIQGGVFRHHPVYRRETSVHALRGLAQRSKYALSESEVMETNALVRLREYGTLGATVAEVTAYRVSHILEEAKKVRANEEPETGDVKPNVGTDIDNESFGM